MALQLKNTRILAHLNEMQYKGLKRNSPYWFVVLLFMQQWSVQSLYSQIIETYDGPAAVLSLVREELSFPIEIFDSKTVAQISVHVNIEHPNPSDLKIEIIPPLLSPRIVLHEFGEAGYPFPDQDILATYDHPAPSRGDLGQLAGRNSSGVWRLAITDGFENNVGTMISWTIEIVPAIIETLSIPMAETINSSTQRMQISLDGYGSFGHNGMGINSAAGGIYQPSPQIPLESTVYQSALFHHNTSQFLSSYDFFPGERLASIPMQKNGDRLLSEFEIDGDRYSLSQWLVQGATNSFSLFQLYDIHQSSANRKDLTISRYLNSRLRDPLIENDLGLGNYPAVRKYDDGTARSLFVFNHIQSASTDESTYIKIADNANRSERLGSLIDLWRPQNQPSFPERLQRDNLGVYSSRQNRIDENYDGDQDGVADAKKGFDAALLLGSRILSNAQGALQYLVITEWGYSSPAEVFGITEEIEQPQPNPTLFPTPAQTDIPANPTATPSPAPAFTPRPVVNQPPYWIKEFPDLRLVAGKPVSALIDLNEYVHDVDTPLGQLQWTLLKPGDFPIHIEFNHWISVDEVSLPNDYGLFTIRVSDGEFAISQDARIRVASLVTRSFMHPKPIIPAVDETVENDSLLSGRIYESALARAPHWSWLNGPTGVTNLTINNENKITVATSQELRSLPGFLSLSAMLSDESVPTLTTTNTPTITPTATASNTPTLTNSPTPFPTSTPSPTLTSTATRIPLPSFTPTLSPTSTRLPANTSTPSPTNTPTPTSVFTQTNTPTATQMSTPSQTGSNTPTATRTSTPRGPRDTPTPTPTPTLGCSLAFQLDQQPPRAMQAGPLQIKQIKNASYAFAVAHFDAGAIGLYHWDNNQLKQSQSAIQTGFGTANIERFQRGDSFDWLALNAIDETLRLFTSASPGQFTQSASLNLEEFKIHSINDPQNGLKFQSLALVGPPGQPTAIVRTLTGLYAIEVGAEKLAIQTRLPLEGNARFVKSYDLDRDGDQDLIVGLRNDLGLEQIVIFAYADGQLARVDARQVDTDFGGNNAEEVAVLDFNNDGRLDLGVLLFSGAIRIFSAKGDGTFQPENDLNPFPPGKTAGMVFGDFDANGRVDLAAIHESQLGLVFYLVCGNRPQAINESRAIPVSASILDGQQYDMAVLDDDNDGDLDIIVVRSLFDDLIRFENAQTP